MPKIILTAEEEIQYLRELDQMQELIPDLEIQVLSEPSPYKGGYALGESKIGDEFRNFLKASNLRLSLADVERK